MKQNNEWLKLTGEIDARGKVKLKLGGRDFDLQKQACWILTVRMEGGREVDFRAKYARAGLNNLGQMVLQEFSDWDFNHIFLGDGVDARLNWEASEQHMKEEIESLKVKIDLKKEKKSDIAKAIRSLGEELRDLEERLRNFPEQSGQGQA